MAKLKSKWADAGDAVAKQQKATVTSLPKRSELAPDETTRTVRTTKPSKPATGPGTLLALQDATETVAELEQKISDMAADATLRKLDTNAIRTTQLANRHAASFLAPSFATLKQEIEHAGGNLQPIKVRPAGEGGYELVYGHRRHQACHQLGLEVLALVEPMDDRQLFIEMDRENRERADLSPYEQGLHYKRALDQHIFASARKMADALSINNGRISQALVLANLPKPVIDSFGSVLDLQYRWGKQLADALDADQDGVIKRATTLAKLVTKPKAATVLATLLGQETATEKSSRRVLGQGREGVLTDANGRVTVTFERGALSKKQTKQLGNLIEEWLAR